ncbi:GIY-YIG nuclease family protein [Acetobacterium tundrae]|uniref:GIY-YIG nuclease family protein n=1 Tax=Acetobacterium tundrae TaxID=132932 RepID=A0ABR6WLR7_9FIRM|nr:GIY-YIG nuclease family protein [Acetobacterium tundrae]MBC3797462.1 GIY-YIG nuclease family protein [Acetobacterium tundrae]
MKKSQSKKEITAAYKEQKQTGGIFVIRNLKTGKLFLDATSNIMGMANRFEFSQKTGSCVSHKLQNDWLIYGGENFVFEIIEKLEMNEDQSIKEFKEDLETLKLLWLEKYDDESCC